MVGAALAAAFGFWGAAGVAAGAAQGGVADAVSLVDDRAGARVEELLGRLGEDPSAAGEVREGLEALLDWHLAYTPETRVGPFQGVTSALRLVDAAEATPGEHRERVVSFLLENPRTREAVADVIGGDHPRAGEAFALLARLIRERGEHVERYAGLAAAIAAVHADPRPRYVNENSVERPDPVKVFDYYRRNERRMVFGVREMPAGLLVYVVDVAAPIAELEWALDRYEGDRRIDERFFEISYDFDHVLRGEVKRVTAAGFSLPNILEHGGVCADQAYFAETVAKAMGIPAAYVVGRDADVSHAWVGFVEPQNRGVRWNFDTGRYDTYKHAQGRVRDPVTRRWVPDGHLALAAHAMTDPVQRRREAAALTDAAARLGVLRAEGRSLPPEHPVVDGLAVRGRPVRDTSVGSQLALLERALRRSAAHSRAWFMVRDMAAGGELTYLQKRAWSSLLYNLAGEEFPDFTFEVVEPMIGAVEDVDRRNGLWNAMAGNYRSRPDLVSRVRLEQGRMWAEHGDAARAWECYMDVVNNYANAGPFVVDALGAAQALLEETGRAGHIVEMYERAWGQIRKPRATSPEFFIQSNWFRVGLRYATALERAGRAEDAVRVRREIGMR